MTFLDYIFLIGLVSAENGAHGFAVTVAIGLPIVIKLFIGLLWLLKIHNKTIGQFIKEMKLN